MQQRQLRLGDILDDYCPRERRITNHAIVAMIGQEVRQTRCTTCDSEHAYKQAKLPAVRRKKDSVAAAYQEVLAEVQPEVVAPPASAPETGEAPPIVERLARPAVAPPPADSVAAPPVEPAGPGPEAAEAPREDEGPVHRRLIRAQLPRQDAQATRPVPQFTIREAKPAGNFKGRAVQRGHAGSASGRGRGRQGVPAGGPGSFGRDVSGHAGGFSPRSSHRPPGAQPHARHPRVPHAGRHARPGKKHSK